MRLGEKQELFARLLATLLNKAHELGFSVRIGDVFRDPRVFGKNGEKKGYGHSKSGHKQKLAIDMNLFKGGNFLQETEDHKELGEWWESQHELCRWGGRFNDGNHYSIEHGGIR